MARDIDDPGWKAVQYRLAEALAPFAADFGGRDCQHGDWADCEDDCGFEDSQPRPDSMPIVQHFVLVISTADMGGVERKVADLVVIDSPGQPGYVTEGLLHVGLHG